MFDPQPKKTSSELSEKPESGIPTTKTVVVDAPRSGGPMPPSKPNLAFEMKHHSGPLPSPETLALYGQIDPSLPREIMARAQSEQAHRHHIEKTIVEAQVADSVGSRAQVARGQWLGAVVAAIVILSATYVGVNGQPVLSGVIGSAALVGIVAVIVTGERRRKHDENQE